jgi:hypothetical protein
MKVRLNSDTLLDLLSRTTSRGKIKIKVTIKVSAEVGDLLVKLQSVGCRKARVMLIGKLKVKVKVSRKINPDLGGVLVDLLSIGTGDMKEMSRRLKMMRWSVASKWSERSSKST